MSEWMVGQFDYHVWANNKVMGHLADLPSDIFSKEVNLGFASIAEVIGHLASAEEVWIARLRGEVPPPLAARRFQNVDEARNYMKRLHENSGEYLRTVQDWERDVDYSNTAGQSFRNSILEIVQQVVNHGTYHRGNITTMLRSLGYPGTQTDYIAYARSKE